MGYFSSMQEARELFKNPEVKKDEDVEVGCLRFLFIIWYTKGNNFDCFIVPKDFPVKVFILT